MNYPEIRVLDHGYVALDDVMGDDRTSARCARTSFRNRLQERTPEQDEKLTDYLIRHGHNTPLEFCQLRFYMKAPMAIGEQYLRHRTQSINKISYRYVAAAREFYVPELDRMSRQSTSNKQGSSTEVVDDPEQCQTIMQTAGDAAFDAYEILLAQGLAKEIARFVLPAGTYTEWFAQMNLHNFFHMMDLRLDGHAQFENQAYARAMMSLAKLAFPSTIALWERFRAERAGGAS